VAICSDYPPLQKWLEETYSGFITDNRPHLRCNLHFDTPLHEKTREDRFLAMAPARNVSETGELEFKVSSSYPAEFFWLILQVCLRHAIAVKRPIDLLLHASGVIHQGKAYLFTGASGAGKSTVCKLLAGDPSFSILHDEVIAISRDDNCFRAWSTPLRGEIGNKKCLGAPIQGIFFLKQDMTNYTTGLNHKKVAELLCYSMITPKYVAADSPSNRVGISLAQLLALAAIVPGYELHFRPEKAFWDCIEGLTVDNPMGTKERESVYVQ